MRTAADSTGANSPGTTSIGAKASRVTAARTRGSMFVAVCAAAALLVSGCSGTSGPQPTPDATSAPSMPSASAPTTDSAAETAAPVETAAPIEAEPLGVFAEAEPESQVPCLDEGFTHLAIEGEHGASAVTVGEGAVGIVLGHQSDGSMCQWADEAVLLAERGYAVILPSLRLRDQVGAFLAAEQWLRAGGAIEVVLAGPSMGGTIAIAAAAAAEVAPAAVIAVSSPAALGRLDAAAGAPRVDAPTLLLAGSNDRDYAAQAAELEAALGGEVTLRVFDSGAHGVQLVDMPEAQGAIDDFLAAHAPAS